MTLDRRDPDDDEPPGPDVPADPPSAGERPGGLAIFGGSPARFRVTHQLWALPTLNPPLYATGSRYTGWGVSTAINIERKYIWWNAIFYIIRRPQNFG